MPPRPRERGHALLAGTLVSLFLFLPAPEIMPDEFTGRPPFDPKDLMTIELYGAMNPNADLDAFGHEGLREPEGQSSSTDNFFEICFRRGNSYSECYDAWTFLITKGQRCVSARDTEGTCTYVLRRLRRGS